MIKKPKTNKHEETDQKFMEDELVVIDEEEDEKSGVHKK